MPIPSAAAYTLSGDVFYPMSDKAFHPTFEASVPGPSAGVSFEQNACRWASIPG
jgi:hypothetical protein